MNGGQKAAGQALQKVDRGGWGQARKSLYKPCERRGLCSKPIARREGLQADRGHDRQEAPSQGEYLGGVPRRKFGP